MNNNDLLNALSGIDPKYIDEASLELHAEQTQEKATETDKPVSSALESRTDDNSVVTSIETADQARRTRRLRTRRIVSIVIPAAAVILFSLTVALPFIIRNGKSESTAPAASDSAFYMATEEAATDSAYYDDAEALADTAPTYESAELNATGSSSSAAGTTAKDSDSSSVLEMETAEYTNGVLTIEISGKLPDNTKAIEYTITGTDQSGSEKIYAEGKLSDILTGKDPLTLDISASDLPAGTYTLSIGEETLDFTVR